MNEICFYSSAEPFLWLLAGLMLLRGLVAPASLQKHRGRFCAALYGVMPPQRCCFLLFCRDSLLLMVGLCWEGGDGLNFHFQNIALILGNKAMFLLTFQGISKGRRVHVFITMACNASFLLLLLSTNVVFP